MKWFLTCFFLFPRLFPLYADSIMTYIYNAPESNTDKRYDYQWEILHKALEKTKAKYGPYLMKPSKFMSEKRQVSELKRAIGTLTIIYLDTNPEFENNLFPVRIPVDKNLVGYRVFLIRKEDQPKFEKIRTLEGLKKIKIGLGIDWIDVKILDHYKFSIETGSNYEGLFKMLYNKRFDAFSRGADEIINEYDLHKLQMPDLHIESTLLLYCPMPMYFWFSKTVEGKRLAKRAEEGMLAMIKDGSYDNIFRKYYGNAIKRLNLKGRRLFIIQNPFLTPETPFKDKRLWFSPLKE